MESMKIVGARLRDVREGLGLTLDAVAQQIGYSKGTLSNIETGKDRPGKRLIEKLSSLLGLEKHWIETGKGEKFTTARMATSNEINEKLGLKGHDYQTMVVTDETHRRATLKSMESKLSKMEDDLKIILGDVITLRTATSLLSKKP